MCEIAFKEWCDRKKQEDKNLKVKEAKLPSFGEKRGPHQQKNSKISYDGYEKKQKRIKSSRRNMSKRKTK